MTRQLKSRSQIGNKIIKVANGTQDNIMEYDNIDVLNMLVTPLIYTLSFHNSHWRVDFKY